MVEDVVEEKDLVVLNDGSGTRVDLVRGTESCPDVTMVSQCLSGRSTWKVLKESTIGSDHYPIVIDICVDADATEREEMEV